ncbi:MAG: DUF5011 domain-containing protein [Ruminococcus sp.]|nr:DUF5011 domain-containing protein [Ruminococcus sp.]
MKRKLTYAAAVLLLTAGLGGCSLFDKEPPVISGVDLTYTERCGSDGKVDTSKFKSGVTAYDEVDGEVPVNMSFDREVDGMGKYTITYTATDQKGNTATVTAPLVVNVPSEPILGNWESGSFSDGDRITAEFSDTGICYMNMGGNPGIYFWELNEKSGGKRMYFASDASYSIGFIAIIDDSNVNKMSLTFVIDDDVFEDVILTYKG